MPTRTRVFGALLLLVGVAVIPMMAEGQTPDPISTGTWILRGGASLSRWSYSSELVTWWNVGLYPAALRFVAPGLAVGLGLTVSRSWQSGPDTVAMYRSRYLGVQGEVAYYIRTRGGAVFPFVRGRVLVSSDRSEQRRPGSAWREYSSSSGWDPGIGGGVLAMIARNVGVETALQFSAIHRERGPTLIPNLTLSVGLGVLIY